MKPRIVKVTQTWWQCWRPGIDTSGPLHCGYGHNPREAYRLWQLCHRGY